MATNIQEINAEKYNELLQQEGDTLPLYYLSALHFSPPRPLTDREAIRRADMDENDLLAPFGMQDEYHYLPIVLLNVHQPMVHKELNGATVFILPADWSEIEYQTLSVIHSEHNAWAYRIEPRFWEADNTDQDDTDDPMEDAHWYFNPAPVPDYDLGNTSTH